MNRPISLRNVGVCPSVPMLVSMLDDGSLCIAAGFDEPIILDPENVKLLANLITKEKPWQQAIRGVYLEDA
jgi:hypothetical protein